jgi:hypothetical protein
MKVAADMSRLELFGAEKNERTHIRCYGSAAPCLIFGQSSSFALPLLAELFYLLADGRI